MFKIWSFELWEFSYKILLGNFYCARDIVQTKEIFNYGKSNYRESTVIQQISILY